MNDYYTVFSRVFCWKGNDEVGVAEAIARTVLAREDLWPQEKEDAQELLESIAELGPCPRKDPDGDWLTEEGRVAERALAFVGLEVEEDDAGWGDGLWLRDHHMLSRHQLEQLRVVLAAVAPLLMGYFLMGQETSVGHLAGPVELWQLDHEPYPRVRHYAYSHGGD